MLVMTGSPAAFAITVQPATWNMIGLDSNSPATGPYRFPVGVKICGGAVDDYTSAEFFWDAGGTDTTDVNIKLRAGTPNPINNLIYGADGCADGYFEVEVTKLASAFNHTRRYHIVSNGISTPTPRELYVEYLISQNRNSIQDIQLDGVSVPPGGTMALVVGGTYNITLVGGTATQGYNNYMQFINLPNTIFQIRSVTTNYNANNSPYVATTGHKYLYADACRWENDPFSPNYRSCWEDWKAGGAPVATTYNVKILAGAAGTDSLNALLFDFSGSSYHYNADYGTGLRFVTVIDPTTVTIDKKFFPTTTSVGGNSKLTFTLSNPNAAPITGVGFSDTFPTSPYAMVVATPPNAVTNGCGTPTFAPVAGAGSFTFSNATIAANANCTVQLDVTLPGAGTYDNYTGNLFVLSTIDTGKKSNTAQLTGSSTYFPNPPPPSLCAGQEVELARWTMDPAQGTTVPPLFFSKAADVSTATASFFSNAGGVDSISAAQGFPAINSWAATGPFTIAGPPVKNYGWSETALTSNNYFEFVLDTSKYGGVMIDFYAGTYTGGDWGNPNSNVFVKSKADLGGFTLAASAPATVAKGSWMNFVATATTTGTASTTFRISADSASKPAALLHLDEVIFKGCKKPNPPTLGKAFTPAVVAVDQYSTLTFTVTNPNVGSTVSGIAFTDTLPAGLLVDTYTAAQCGGTLTASADRYTLTFSAGSLAGAGTCNITASVKAVTSGPHSNVTGFITATESGTNSTATGSGSANLTAVLPPTIGKIFEQSPILADGYSVLTFTLQNPNQNDVLSGVAFTDTLPTSPAQMKVWTTPTPVTPTSGCGTPTFAPTANATAITFTNGTIAGGSKCYVKVNVYATTLGFYDNYSNNVSHTINAAAINGNTAYDQLEVQVAYPQIALFKQVSSSLSGPWTTYLPTPIGGNVYYKFTVENPSGVALTNVSVSDPAIGALSNCIYANLAKYDSYICYSSAPVSAVSGVHTNTATVSATYAGNPYTDVSSATYATTAMSLVKTGLAGMFSASGDIINYEFQVTNTGSATLTGDPLTRLLAVYDNYTTNESCPSLTGIGNFDNFLNAGESVTCTASYVVQPADVTRGFITNDAYSSAVSSSTNSNHDTYTINYAHMSLVKSSPDPTFAIAGQVLRYNYQVTNDGNLAVAGPLVVYDDYSTDESCPALTTIGNKDAVFDIGEVIDCYATYTVLAADVTRGFITNDAYATATGSGLNSIHDTLTINYSPSHMSLVKTAQEATFSAAGNVLHYNFQVTNDGYTTLTGPLVLYDDFAIDEYCAPVTTFNIGAVVDCYASYTVLAADVTRGFITNDAYAQAIGSGVFSTHDTYTVNYAVITNPSLDKAFAAPTIDLYGTTTLTFTISNVSGSPVQSNISFTDNLPAEVKIAAIPNDSYTCGNATTVSAPAGGGVITVTNLDMYSGLASCTVSVDVTSSVVGGPYVNNAASITPYANIIDAVTDSNLTVLPLATLTKAFGLSPVGVSQYSTLTFTIDNPLNGPARTGISFTDTFPTDLVIAAVPNDNYSCIDATITATPGAGSVSVSGISIAAGASNCTISVDVYSISAGSYINGAAQISPYSATLTNGVTDQTLVVEQASLDKAFSPTLIDIYGTSTLTFTITNGAGNTVQTGLSFTDTLPSNVVIAALPNDSYTCGDATVTAVAGAGTISVAGLDMYSGLASCTVSVDVTSGIVGGPYDNTLLSISPYANLTNAVTTTGLTVQPVPVLTKVFGSSPVGVGQTSTLTFTITNPLNSAARTGLTFTDTFPAGLGIAATPNAVTSCVGNVPTFTAVAGTSVFTVGGAGVDVAVGASSCTVSVDVYSDIAGSYINGAAQISPYSAVLTNGVTDQTLVVEQASLNKAFSPTLIDVYGTSTLTFTITNGAGNPAQTGLSFSDTLPAEVKVAAVPNDSYTCGNAVITAVAGAGTIAVSNLDMYSGLAACTISVDVTSGIVGGAYNNTAASISPYANLTNAVTTTGLTVQPVPVLTKVFGSSPVGVGQTSTLTFTITNPLNSAARTGLTFTDTFPAGLGIAATPNAVTSCVGNVPTFTAVAGTSVFTVGGAGVDVAVGASSCTVSVDVYSDIAGSYVNGAVQISPYSTSLHNGVTDQTLTVVKASLDKAFSPTTIDVYGTSTLTFTITNGAGNPQQPAISFIDTLPAEVKIAAIANDSYTCGNSTTITATPGSGTITVSNLDLYAGLASCTVSVDVTSSVIGGAYNNTSANINPYANITNVVTPTGLTVRPTPTLTKAFASSLVGIGQSSKLTFTISNPLNSGARTGITFTDTFPVGLGIASPQNVTDNCGGVATITAVAGSGVITVGAPGASIGDNQTCTISVDVYSDIAGSYVNGAVQISPYSTSLNNGVTDQTLVVGQPSLNKAFAPTTIDPYGISTLTFTVTNVAGNPAQAGISFIDNLPTEVVIAGIPNDQYTCGNATTISAPAGGSTITVTNLDMYSGLAACTVSVDVTSSVVGGPYDNTAANINPYANITNAVTTTGLTVQPKPTLTKAFGTSPLGVGQVSTLTFTISNPLNSAARTGLTFTDTFPLGLGIAATANVVNNCGGAAPTFTADPYTGVFIVGGSGVDAATGASTCTISVDVYSDIAASYVNGAAQISPYSAILNNGVTDQTLVVTQASLNKAFSPNSIVVNGTSTLTFTITNNGAGSPAQSGITFTDTLPTNVVIAAVPADSYTCSSAQITATAGTGVITVNGLSMNSGLASCTVSVNVTSSVVGGPYLNTAARMSALTRLSNAVTDSGLTVTAVAAGVNVSGLVYNDANNNGLLDGAEDWTAGVDMYAKLATFNGSACVTPVLSTLTLSAPAGSFVFPNVSNGDYCLILSTDNNVNSVLASVPSGWSNVIPTDGILHVTVNGNDVTNQNFGLYHANSLSGIVFKDDGIGGGTANDGVKNGSETGIPGVVVKATDATGSIVYASTITRGDGSYILALPATANGVVKIVETNLSTYISTGASIGDTGDGVYNRAADAITFTYNSGTSYTGLNFGDVPESGLNNDGMRYALPGAVVFFPHTFIANTNGDVSFSTTNVASPANPLWTDMLYEDTNCNAQIDGGEPVISNPVAVTTGQSYCLLLKQFTPSNAPFDARNVVTVQAAFVYANATPGINATYTRTDTTIIGNEGLTLIKSVDKAQALPGDTITYTIVYTNPTSGLLDNLIINDVTPAYTTFTSASCGVLPFNLTVCTIVDPGVGNPGPLKWQMTGTLAPASSGSVSYTVTVTP